MITMDILQVLVSIATYTLFLLDARRQTFWEKLDDYVYYIRAFGNSVEFCFGIFLFFNGAWILVFESGKEICFYFHFFFINPARCSKHTLTKYIHCYNTPSVTLQNVSPRSRKNYHKNVEHAICTKF